MRRTAVFAAALALLAGAGTVAEAQEPLRLRVRPRSFLDPGKVVQPGSSVNPASAQGQMISYLANPPYSQMRDFYGNSLPDPVTNGPFIGSSGNLLGPVDYGEPFFGPLD